MEAGHTQIMANLLFKNVHSIQIDGFEALEVCKYGYESPNL